MNYSEEIMPAIEELLSVPDLFITNPNLNITLNTLTVLPARYDEMVKELEVIGPQIEELEKKYAPYEKQLEDITTNRSVADLVYKLGDSWPHFMAMVDKKSRLKTLDIMIPILEKEIRKEIDTLHEQLSGFGDELLKTYPQLAKSISKLKKFKFEDLQPQNADDGYNPGSMGE